MKHISYYFCAALLGTAVLTACSGAEKVKSNTPVQITMWNYYNGAQKEEMDRLVQEFNDTVGLEQKIVVESVSKGSVSELEDELRDSPPEMLPKAFIRQNSVH
jgi:multiple sugar transport system substrate-binding protein